MTKLQLKGKLRFLVKDKKKGDTVRLNNDIVSAHYGGTTILQY